MPAKLGEIEVAATPIRVHGARSQGELLAARMQPHQSVGLMSHGIVLEQGEHKEGAARALLECAMAFPQLVPIVATQARQGAPEIAAFCTEILHRLVEAGDKARESLGAG